MRQPKLRDQIDSVREVLADTRKNNLDWESSGQDETYAAVRGHDSAVLRRNSENLVELQFMTDDRPDWAVTLAQLGPNAEPSLDELNRDGLLALLWEVVVGRIEVERTDSMRRFTGRSD